MRVLAALVGALGVFAAVSAALAPVATAAGTPSPSAVTDYGTCLADQKAGALLLLIDTSPSLRESDPLGARVDAAQYLIDRLNAFAEQRKVTLDVAVAGFSSNFEPTIDWTQLTAATLPDLKNGIGAFRSKTDGVETDYWTALEGARRLLGDKAPKGQEQKPCQAIAWFTDGQLAIVAHDTADKRARGGGTTKPYPAPNGSPVSTDAEADRAAAAASTDLCRPGGVADQLRNSGIVIFGIGLSDPKKPPPDFSLMKSIVTGVPLAQQPCGVITDPTPGDFEPASNLDSLLQAFDRIPTSGTSLSSGICQVDITTCASRYQFVLDSSVEDVHILGTANADGIDAQLLMPNAAAAVSLTTKDNAAHSVVQGGTTISYQWRTPRTVEIELTRAAAAPTWPGVWSFAFVDPAGRTPSGVSQANIKIWGNLLPALLDKDKTRFTSGSRTPINVGLVKADDASAVSTGAWLGKIAMTVQLVQAGGAPVTIADKIDKDALGNAIDVDLTDVKPGAATLRLTLDLTTQPPPGFSGDGTALEPETVDIPISIVSPLGYPDLVPSKIDFGIADGTTNLQTHLTVVGPGCVWLDPAAPLTVAGSPDGAKVAITAAGANSGATCLAVQDGQRSDLTLTLATDHVANGTASGTVPVSIAPLGRPADSKTVDVAFTADLRKPFEIFNAIWALISALLLGPGIPLLLLYLLKRLGARIPDRPLHARLIPVIVSGGRVERDGSPFAVHDSDFVDLVPFGKGSRRRLNVGDGVVLRTRVGRSPLGAGFVTVGEPPLLGAGSVPPRSYGRALQGRLPLAVHNTWTVLVNPGDPPERATVLMLVGADAPPERRAELSLDVASGLPEVLHSLRQAAEQRGLIVAATPVGAGVGGGHGPGGGPPPFGAPPPGPSQPYGAPPFGAPPAGAPQPYGAPPAGSPQPYGAPPAGAPQPYGAPFQPDGTPPAGAPQPFGPQQPFGPPPGAALPYGAPSPYEGPTAPHPASPPYGGASGSATSPLGRGPSDTYSQPDHLRPPPREPDTQPQSFEQGNVADPFGVPPEQPPPGQPPFRRPS